MNRKVPFLHTALLFIAILFSQSLTAQEATSIEEDYDFLTAEWLRVSGELKTYAGLERFCTSPDFREQTSTILGLLHHYDSLVLEVLLDPTKDLHISHREYKKTVRDIQEFEEDFSIRKFITFLRENCGAWKELERSKNDLVKASGVYSYDGKLLVLEDQLRKYLKHIDKMVIAIDDHVHLIHIDQVRSFRPVSESQ